MSEPIKPATPAIDQSGLKLSYANVCRIAQTPNEVLIDFGLNPNFFGQILEEPLKLDNRIIMSQTRPSGFASTSRQRSRILKPATVRSSSTSPSACVKRRKALGSPARVPIRFSRENAKPAMHPLRRRLLTVRGWRFRAVCSKKPTEPFPFGIQFLSDSRSRLPA